jgi:hypothetical protein
MKSLFRFIFRLSFFLIFIFSIFRVFYWYQNRFPKAIAPVTVSYDWNYAGEKYSLSQTLYQSIYDYYQKKSKGIYTDLEESSIEKYLTYPTEDQTIKKLANQLVSLATSKKLSRDETAELIIAFIQSINYDLDKAKSDRTHPIYPYEVLFTQKGICSDKSFLVVALLRELGYGTAFFMFPEQEHMAAAILCPSGYTNFNSKYCIIESTAIGNKIGIVPNIDKLTFQAVKPSIEDFETVNKLNSQKLTTVKIFNQTEGAIYQGVIKTATIMGEMKEIDDYLATQDKKIKSAKTQLANIETTMTNYKNSSDYENFNQLVPEQNRLVRSLNSLVAQYNIKVKRFNSLIGD